MSSASTQDTKLATDVMDSVVVKQSPALTKQDLSRKRKLQHLCLDKTYNSKTVKRNSSAEAMYRIYRAREKEGRSRQKHKKFQIEKNILPEDGWW